MTTVKLRPHHVARLIDHQSNIASLVPVLLAAEYDSSTASSSIGLLQSLLEDPKQFVDVIGNDEVGEDSICSRCSYNVTRQCTLPGSLTIAAHNSTDVKEALRYGLDPGFYRVQELLDRRPAFHPKLRI